MDINIEQLQQTLNEEFYTVRDMAKIFKVSNMTIINWIRSTKHPVMKVGSRYRIPKQTVVLMAADNITQVSTQHEQENNDQ